MGERNGVAVLSRELKRVFVTKETEKKGETVVKVVEDHWSVIEADVNENILSQKDFNLNEWSEAVDYFEELSGTPVDWEDDIPIKPKYDWMSTNYDLTQVAEPQPTGRQNKY